MTLRKRLTLIAAASVGVAVLVAVAASYVVVRSQLRSQVDSELTSQAAVDLRVGYLEGPIPGISASSGGPAPYAQVVLANDTVVRREGGLALPIPARALRIASTGSGFYMADVYVGNSHLRMLCVPAVAGFQRIPAVLELARPLNGVDSILRHLRAILALLLVGGIALAAALGRMASRRVLAPLAEVAQVAQHIGETDDLTERLLVHADDEVGQLAMRFNAMLDRLEGSRAALDESVRAQRQ
ncbi:MAG: HAMP domain-containing protein, partial [Solirubrobacteraceae bacterium]